MDRIWAGWRSAYLSGELQSSGVQVECVLCTIASGEFRSVDSGGYSQEEDELLVVYRGDTVTLALNLYPYTSGHLLVIPSRHIAELDQISPAERSEMLEVASRATVALGKSHSAAGFNIGMNLGKSAGAAISDHLHMHVVPRFVGDSNFMTTTADARVLPEALADTLSKIRLNWS